MNIYIDKSNLLSVVHSAKKKNYNDCMRMLKDNFRIFFTFSKHDIVSLEQNDKQDVMQWLTQMVSGIKSSNTEPVKWDSAFPARPLDIASFNPEQLSSVYMGHRTKRIRERGDEKHRKPFIYKELRGLRL